MYNLTCDVCGAAFTSRYATKKRCSDKCHKVRNRKRYGYSDNGLPTNFLGRLHEYVVMNDLGLRGYDVYYSAFPQQKYDIVIANRKTGDIRRVEVKTGYMQENGRVNMPKHQHNDWDIMAVVVRRTNEIWYLDHDGKTIDL